MFHAKNFSGTSGEFPIGFLVWDLSKNKHIKDQKIVLDVYNNDCEKIGTKEILTKERTALLSKWVTRPATTKVFPPFSSGITVSERTNDVRNRIADSFLCSLMCCGNDIQHQRYTSLLSGPYASAGAFSVISDNFEKSMIVHAVRMIPKHTWDRDRDQFYQPYNNDLPQEFINDCVIWSAFAPSNNTVSLKDVNYNGKIYQIHNEMFPFLLNDMTSWKCGHSGISSQLFSANEDRFLAKWIDEHKFSEEATAVLTSARELYKYVYEQINTVRWLDYKIELWDVGWWQIKEAAKVMPNAEELFNGFKRNFDLLSRKILPLISEYGFLPPDIKLF